MSKKDEEAHIHITLEPSNVKIDKPLRWGSPDSKSVAALIACFEQKINWLNMRFVIQLHQVINEVPLLHNLAVWGSTAVKY